MCVVQLLAISQRTNSRLAISVHTWRVMRLGCRIFWIRDMAADGAPAPRDDIVEP